MLAAWFEVEASFVLLNDESSNLKRWIFSPNGVDVQEFRLLRCISLYCASSFALKSASSCALKSSSNRSISFGSDVPYLAFSFDLRVKVRVRGLYGNNCSIDCCWVDSVVSIWMLVPGGSLFVSASIFLMISSVLSSFFFKSLTNSTDGLLFLFNETELSLCDLHLNLLRTFLLL